MVESTKPHLHYWYSFARNQIMVEAEFRFYVEHMTNLQFYGGFRTSTHNMESNPIASSLHSKFHTHFVENVKHVLKSLKGTII